MFDEYPEISNLHYTQRDELMKAAGRRATRAGWRSTVGLSVAVAAVALSAIIVLLFLQFGLLAEFPITILGMPDGTTPRRVLRQCGTARAFDRVDRTRKGDAQKRCSLFCKCRF